ncbi:MAG: lyase family protein, partial [Candidatus Cloacimonadaceae bacterium]
VIQPDRHVQFMFTIAQIGSTLEKIALEIRHLQRTEVHEAEENFSRGQKGSSAMPHKRNPILSEQLCGLSRILRANAAAALENNPLWHERDISHSSVERIILPDSSILIHYMLVKSSAMIESLGVYPENMLKNIELTGGLVFSQALLLNLTNTGMSREDSYALVQTAAMKSINDGEDFKKLILDSKEITSALGASAIEEIFSYERYLKNVDQIFRRCGII